MPRKPKTISVHHDHFDQVKFTDHDGDIFFIGLGAAIKYCKQMTRVAADLDGDAIELLVILEEWMKKNRIAVANVAIRPEAGWLHFYVASPGDHFDVQLSERLAEFESECISRLAFLRVDARQVSSAELEEIRTLMIQRPRCPAKLSTSHSGNVTPGCF
jgi:hypothetical protein